MPFLYQYVDKYVSVYVTKHKGRSEITNPPPHSEQWWAINQLKLVFLSRKMSTLEVSSRSLNDPHTCVVCTMCACKLACISVYRNTTIMKQNSSQGAAHYIPYWEHSSSGRIFTRLEIKCIVCHRALQTAPQTAPHRRKPHRGGPRCGFPEIFAVRCGCGFILCGCGSDSRNRSKPRKC